MENQDTEIIASFKEFASDASSYFNDEIVRIKNDREFAGGQQFNDNDELNRGSGRAEVPYNFVSNYINAIVNPFKKSPYSIGITAKSEESKPIAMALQGKIKDIESLSNAKFAIHNALRDSVTAGYGYAYVTTETDDLDEDANVDIKVYPVADATMVIPDVSSKEVDGSDSEQMAIVEHIKVAKARSLFGDDIVGDMKYRGPIVGNFGETWRAPEGSLALVTYFKRKRTDIPGKAGKKVTIEFFKMIGDKIVERGELDCPYIPIVAFKGEDVFRKGKKISIGIVDKAKYPQKTINYANSQLRERLSKSPKPIFLSSKSAVQGNEEYYENMDKTFNPLILFNDKAPDGSPIAPPTKIDNLVVTGDLSGIIDANINYMSLIIGMPATGLTGTVGQNETAESVLMRSRSSESNQSHYYENAKISVKHIGRILTYFIKQMQEPEVNLKGIEIIVNDGPELITQREDERKTLLAFNQVAPENMKVALLPILAKTLDLSDSDLLMANINQALPIEFRTDANKEEDPAAKTIMDEMSSQIDQYKAKYDEAMNAVMQLQNNVIAMQEDSQSKILIAEMNNRTKLQTVAMQEQGDNNRLAASMVAESEKEIVKLQSNLAEIRQKRAEQLERNVPSYSMQMGIPRL